MYKLSVEVQFDIKYSYNAFKRNQNRNIKAKKKKKNLRRIKIAGVLGEIEKKGRTSSAISDRRSIEEIQEKNNFL